MARLRVTNDQTARERRQSSVTSRWLAAIFRHCLSDQTPPGTTTVSSIADRCGLPHCDSMQGYKFLWLAVETCDSLVIADRQTDAQTQFEQFIT